MIRTSIVRRGLIPVLIAVAVVVSDQQARAASVMQAPSGPAIACAADDPLSDAFRQWLVGIASGGDSTAVYRDEIGIPVLADSAIEMVSDTALCDLAARKHASAAQEDSVSPLPVHLLRLGSHRYIAFNGLRQGEFRVYFVFDQSFSLKTSYMM